MTSRNTWKSCARACWCRGVAAVATWFARRAEIEEVGSPSDAQLADIGISRSEAPLVFDRDFPDRRERDYSIATLA